MSPTTGWNLAFLLDFVLYFEPYLICCTQPSSVCWCHSYWDPIVIQESLGITLAIIPNLEVLMPWSHRLVMHRPWEEGHPHLFSYGFHLENLPISAFTGSPISWYFDHYFPHLIYLSFNGVAMYSLVHWLGISLIRMFNLSKTICYHRTKLWPIAITDVS